MILKDKVFYTALIGFFVGVSISSIFNVDMYVSIFFVLLGLFLLLIKFLIKFQDLKLLFLIIVILSAGLGSFRLSLDRFFDKDNVLDEFLEQEVTLEGEILAEPKVKETNTQLRVFLEDEKVGILVFADLYPQFSYGDRVRLQGKLQKPENFETDTGRVFNYVSYLGKDKIFYQMFYPEIELIDSQGGNFIKRNLFALKDAFLRSIKKVVPDPHSALLGGITVGAEESLGDKLQDDFRKTGIIHIVVLSGYNVTIVAEFFMRMFSFMPILWKSIIGALSIALFMIMTGASATIVRASIMAVLVIISRITGRTTDMLRLLLIAGALMVLHNPNILMFDPSFQLSFLATLGLIYLSPHIEKYLKIVPKKADLRGFATATISTQIFVLPLLLYMTGSLSLVAVPVNLLVLPVIPISMLLGLLTGMFGFISTAISFPIGFVNFVLLDYVLKVVNFFAGLSFASVSIKSFSVWAMLFVYAVYIFLFLKLRKKKEPSDDQ